jgi:hypothetical protein
MQRICPKTEVWYDIYKKLKEYSSANVCKPSTPPINLILTGWICSDDVGKMNQWKETEKWAERNGCKHLIPEMSDDQWYWVQEIQNLTFRIDGKSRKDSASYYKAFPKVKEDQLIELIDRLKQTWGSVAGAQLSKKTKAVAFTGSKGRRLLVSYATNTEPPWGSWHKLSHLESKRREFTRFRASINAVIAPHEVDHIDFWPE